ncbi:hypothetical protein CAMGR0001_0920 [Campylobacter gracilis RM3268]|uniref:Uncharacterized protein n=1 Tax=Campylobacter gracilis RM3268 TaxID=553220 RepID=C8PGC7_9BACT|nr:hypothetical protein CAMGR0001_0920 [Campylobacter gracilis RM3268]
MEFCPKFCAFVADKIKSKFRVSARCAARRDKIPRLKF